MKQGIGHSCGTRISAANPVRVNSATMKSGMALAAQRTCLCRTATRMQLKLASPQLARTCQVSPAHHLNRVGNPRMILKPSTRVSSPRGFVLYGADAKQCNVRSGNVLYRKMYGKEGYSFTVAQPYTGPGLGRDGSLASKKAGLRQ